MTAEAVELIDEFINDIPSPVVLFMLAIWKGQLFMCTDRRGLDVKRLRRVE
jgi:hypothetical protein